MVRPGTRARRRPDASPRTRTASPRPAAGSPSTSRTPRCCWHVHGRGRGPGRPRASSTPRSASPLAAQQHGLDGARGRRRRQRRARSPASCCSARPGRCPRPPATTAPRSPPPPRTGPARCSGCSPSWPCAASTSPASSRARSRTGTPSTGSTSTAPATSPSPRWARRWPRCTAAATGCASSAPTRGPARTAGRPGRRPAARSTGLDADGFAAAAALARAACAPGAHGVRLVLARHGRTAGERRHRSSTRRPPGARSTSSAARRRTSWPAGWPASPVARRATPRARSGRSRRPRRWPPRTALAVDVVDGVQEVSAATSRAAPTRPRSRRSSTGLRRLVARRAGRARCPAGSRRWTCAPVSCRAVERIVGGGDGDGRAGQPRCRDPAGGGRAARRHAPRPAYVPNAGLVVLRGARPRPAGCWMHWDTGRAGARATSPAAAQRRRPAIALGAAQRRLSPSPARAGCPRRCRSGGRSRAPRSPRPRRTTSSSSAQMSRIASR